MSSARPPRPPLPPALQRVRQTPDDSDSDLGEDDFVDVLKEASLEEAVAAAPSPPQHKPARRSGFWIDLKEAMEAAKTTPPAPVKPELPQLQVKVLKFNVRRFNLAVARLSTLFEFFTHLQRWDNPPATFLALSFYVMFVMMGRLLLGLVLCCILFLLVQYLRYRGLLPPLTVVEDEDDERGLREKVKYVGAIARKIQFMIGHYADNLEKVDNLLEWKEPANTKKIAQILAVAFVVVLLVPFNIMCYVGQIFFGVKFFFVDAIYLRFPSMKEKYDTTYIFWCNLPTNADLDLAEGDVSRQSSTSSLQPPRKLDKSSRPGSSSKISSSKDTSPKPKKKEPLPEQMQQFLGADASESVIDSWGCLDLTKGSIWHSKKGRIFLTQNFLCFFRGAGDPNNVAIPLKRLTSIQKARPISMVPRGFALEFHVKGATDTEEGTSYTFGALMSRDQVYTMVSEQAKLPIDPDKLD